MLGVLVSNNSAALPETFLVRMPKVWNKDMPFQLLSARCSIIFTIAAIAILAGMEVVAAFVSAHVADVAAPTKSTAPNAM